MRVRAGAPPEPTSMVTMTAALFRELLAGHTAFDDAFAAGQIDWFGTDADHDLFRRILAIPGGGERQRNGWRGAAAHLAARWR